MNTLPRFRRGLLLAVLSLAFALLAGEAFAQSVTVDLGTEGSLTGRIVQLVLLVTVLSLAPSILVMVTAFTRIVIVLSLLRMAMGVQQSPPNSVIVSLALFLTAFVMAPVFNKIYDDALQPLMSEQITAEQAIERGVEPVRGFMLAHVREKDLGLFIEMTETEMPETPEATPLHLLVPAFMISEIRRAFEIGFLLFVPFLVIDMVVASVLMAMGMMMLPPIIVSLPFKLIFFVLVDGWYMVAGSLVRSFGS